MGSQRTGRSDVHEPCCLSNYTEPFVGVLKLVARLKNERVSLPLFSHRSVPDRYLDTLVKSNIFTLEEAKRTIDDHSAWLNQALKQVDAYVPEPACFEGFWKGMQQAEASVTQWDTGVDLGLLRFVAEKSVRVDDDSVRSENRELYINRTAICSFG